MRLVLLALAATFHPSLVHAADNARRIAVTPSGNPEMMLAGFDLDSAKASIEELCKRLSWAVKKRSAGMVICGVPSDERVEVYLRRPVGSNDWFKGGTHVIVQKEVRFQFAPHGADTYIQALAFKRRPNPDGDGFTDVALQADDTFNGLINVLALTGATFVPGTLFPDLPWYGFDADEVFTEKVDGRSVAAIRVGHVEASGTGAAAGLRNGDVIVGIDGRRYREKRSLLRQLALAREGSSITFDILRDGLVASHQVIVAARPIPHK